MLLLDPDFPRIFAPCIPTIRTSTTSLQFPLGWVASENGQSSGASGLVFELQARGRVDKFTNAGKNASRGGLFVIESSDRRPASCPHRQRLRHSLGYHSKRGPHSCERQGVVVSIVCMTRLRVGPGCYRQMRIGHDGRSVRRKLRFHTRIYRRLAQSSGTMPGWRILAFGYAH